MSNKVYDTIIIGFGKGGKTAAGFLASQGERVALIEKDNTMYGGTCINVGCIPSKSLVTWANRAKFKGNEENNQYFQRAIARKRQLIEALRGKNYNKVAQLDNVDVIDGFASFVDDKNIKVSLTAGGEEVLTGKRIIINTGAKSNVPNIPGLQLGKRAMTSEGLLDLDELPKDLVIIGGGYIGLEFASMYADFGSKVTILEYGDKFLPREDRDVADAIKASLEAKNVTVVTNAKTEAVEESANSITVKYNNGTAQAVTGDVLLVAAGRTPNTAGLNLEAAGVKVNERGAVVVNENRQTSVAHIYAFGDVVGAHQFTYISLDDFRIFKNHYLNKKIRKAEDRIIPYSVFIEPAFSRVGLSEAEAKAQGLDYQVVSMPAAAIPKANVLQSTVGLLKAIVENKTGKILGVVLFCEESHEMINIVATAMELGGTYETLRDQIFTHPTMSEALNDLFGMVK